MASDLVVLAKPGKKSYEELVTRSLEAETISHAEQFQFHRRDQAGSKSVAEYVTELRRLADKLKTTWKRL